MTRNHFGEDDDPESSTITITCLTMHMSWKPFPCIANSRLIELIGCVVYHTCATLCAKPIHACVEPTLERAVPTSIRLLVVQHIREAWHQGVSVQCGRKSRSRSPAVAHLRLCSIDLVQTEPSLTTWDESQRKQRNSRTAGSWRTRSWSCSPGL
jgi:hypothetical protein